MENNPFLQQFAARHPGLMAFINSFIARAKKVFSRKKTSKQETNSQSGKSEKPTKVHDFPVGELILLLLQIALMIGAIWLLWYILLVVLQVCLVVSLAVIGLMLNFVAGIAVPDLPQMIPNFFHLCDWAMAFGDAMVSHLIQYFCKLFEDGIPNPIELWNYIFKSADVAPFWATIDQFWTELVTWAASL